MIMIGGLNAKVDSANMQSENKVLVTVNVCGFLQLSPSRHWMHIVQAKNLS